MIHLSFLSETVCVGVTHERCFQVESASFDHIACEVGDIMASIALTRQVEIFIFELRVGVQDLLNEVQELVRSFFHICQEWLTVRKACTDWLVNIDDSA